MNSVYGCNSEPATKATETGDPSSSGATSTSSDDATASSSDDETSSDVFPLDHRTVELVIYRGHADATLDSEPLFVQLPQEIQGAQSDISQTSRYQDCSERFHSNAQVLSAGGQQVIVRRSNWPKDGEVQILTVPTPLSSSRLLATIGGVDEMFCQFEAGDFNGDDFVDLALARCDFENQPILVVPGDAQGFAVDAGFDVALPAEFPYLDSLFSWQETVSGKMTSYLGVTLSAAHPLAETSLLDPWSAYLAKQQIAMVHFDANGGVKLVATDLGERGNLWFRPRNLGSTVEGRPRFLTAYSPRKFSLLDVDTLGRFSEVGALSLGSETSSDDPTESGYMWWPIAENAVAVADVDHRDGPDVFVWKTGSCGGCCNKNPGGWFAATKGSQFSLHQPALTYRPGLHNLIVRQRNLPERVFADGYAGLLEYRDDSWSEQIHSPGPRLHPEPTTCTSAIAFDYDLDGVDDIGFIVDWSQRDFRAGGAGDREASRCVPPE